MPDKMERLERPVTVATVMAFIAQIFGLGTRGTAIAFVLSLVGYFAFTKLIKPDQLEQRLRALPITSPVLIATVLVAILVGSLLRQHSIDSKIVDIGEVTDTFHWRVRFCFGKPVCMAGVLADLGEKIPSRSTKASAELFSDQALGAVVRTSSPALELLNRLYGVSDRFLGTGESLPSGEAPFESQRMPEFVVPNYGDHHIGVLVWRLAPGVELNKSVTKLLDSAPMAIQSAPQSIDQTRSQIKAARQNLNTPALIRFAMVPDVNEGGKELYSGCFGLPFRQRVFFSSLDYMEKNTTSVQQAAELSGYQFSSQNQHLYVFMFAPFNATEVYVPTWRRVLDLANRDVAATPVCHQNSP